ncbi:MAG: LamG-like jellyroll fold domain-containing protein [Pseudomonadota bacterium]
MTQSANPGAIVATLSCLLLGTLLALGGCAGDGGGQGGADTGAPLADASGSGDGLCFAPPDPEITLPDDGTRFEVDDEVVFHGLVSNRGEPRDTWSATWTSNLDGLLCSAPPGDGASQCVVQGMSMGLHEVTLSVTDDCAIVGEASISIVINGAPTTPAVQISPGAPTTADNLEASLADPPEDPNGDDVTLTWVWLKDDVMVGNLAGPHVSATLTTRDETWTVRVTASDGTLSGKAMTASVTIGNSLPSIQGVQIMPSSGGATTAFTCVPSGWSDPDGAAEAYAFRWTVNGGVDADQTAAALTADLTKGDVIRCAATPLDDEGAGETLESDPVTVVNTPPSCDAALLDPTEGDVTTVFTCAPEGCADPDGDAFNTQVIWVLDGAELPSSTTDVITAQAIGASKGDTLQCKIFGSDGGGAGSPVKSVMVTLGNAPPLATSAVVGPLLVHEEEVVTCTSSGWQDPDGDPEDSLYQWTVNDVVVEGQTDPTLSSVFFDKGDTITCAVIPFDGTDEGAAVESKVDAHAVDTAPALAAALVSPGTGSKAVQFTCAAAGWTDPDPADHPDLWGTPDDMDVGVPGYLYLWKVNGLAVPNTLTVTWQPVAATKGDTLSCAVTPYDGELSGAAVDSQGVLLLNAPPAVGSVDLTPNPGGKNATFTCVPNAYDDPDDGDPEIYLFQWFKGGVLLPAQELSTLDGAAAGLAQGDQLVCTVTPFDGEAYGAPVSSAPLVITNSLPSITGVVIQPGDPVTGDDLVCAPQGWQDLDGDPPGYQFQWSVNQALLGSQTTNTLSHTLTKKGDGVVCVVTPFDGVDGGFVKSSGVVTIGNTPPPPPDVLVIPGIPGLGQDLTCAVDPTPADPDGDAVTLEYTWSLDGQELAGQEGQTLDGEIADSCDVVRCQATAWDGEDPSAPGWDDAMVDGTPGLGIHEAAHALTVPDHASLQFPDGELTAELWVMPMAGAVGPLLTKRSAGSGFSAAGFEVFLDDQGRASFRVDTGAGGGVVASASFPLAEGVFTHVAGTYDGASVRLFVQGVLVDAASITGGVACAEPLVVGMHPLTGAITDVVVDEIRLNEAAMYGSNFAPATVLSVGPDTRLMLHLNEGVGNQAADISGHGNDGSCAACDWSVGACAVQVENLPPSQPTVEIIPAAPGPSDDLVCNVVVESTDPEGQDVIYDFAWTSTGGEQVDGNVVPSSLTQTGETWTCTATPFDGGVYGPAGTAQATVLGAQPIVPSGTYTLSPGIYYSCAYTLVTLNYNLFTFIVNGSSMSVQPMMNNGGCLMTGTYNPQTQGFTVGCVFPGTCNETYALTGTFNPDNSWNGTWSVNFSGMWCVDCSYKSVYLTGTKL